MGGEATLRGIPLVIGSVLDVKLSIALIAVFIGALLDTMMGHVVGKFPSVLIGLITSGSHAMFITTIGIYTLYILLLVTILVLTEWISENMSIYVRWRLTSKIHKLYFKGNTFYEIHAYQRTLDNQDSRIAQDCANFANDLHLVFQKVIKTPLIMICYSYLVAREIGEFALLACYLLCMLWTCLSRLVMTPVMKLSYYFETTQAKFRDSHVRVHESAEVIALAHGQMCERGCLEKRFDGVLDAQKRRAKWTFPLSLLVSAFSLTNNAFVFLIFYAYPPEIGSASSMAVFVSRASFIILMLLSGVGSLSDVLADVSRLAGHAARVRELQIILRRFKPVVGNRERSDCVSLTNVDIVVPETRQTLMRNLTFRVLPGESLFISGASGCGKSSIFRVIGGIWPLVGGSMKVPEKDDIMILPQKPYIPEVSFLRALAFPREVAVVRDDRIREAVSLLGLEEMMRRPDDAWFRGLSPGEKQKIALARVLIHRPMFALLDEATCAIPQTMEAMVFRAFRDFGISVLSIPHNPSLRVFHTHSLEINSDGSHRFFRNDLVY